MSSRWPCMKGDGPRMATSVSSPNGLQLAGWDLYRSRITGYSGSARSNGMVPPAEISAYAILAVPQRLNRNRARANFCTCRMPLPSEMFSALTRGDSRPHASVLMEEQIRAVAKRGCGRRVSEARFDRLSATVASIKAGQ